MPTVPIPLVGQSYESRTMPLSAQVTLNLYPEPSTSGLSDSALLSWPGAKMFAESISANRGMYHKQWLGYVFTVEGTNLIKTNSTGTKTTVGAIPGKARCVFAGDTFFLYVVTEGLVYRTDGSTVESITDPDLETPNSAAFLKNTIVYDGDEGTVWISSPGDGGNIGSLDYVGADSSADDVVRVYTFRDNLIIFGTDSLEQWYYSGVDNPPIDPYQGSARPIGLASVHAVTQTDKAVYFLGHDRTIYRLEGYEPNQVSSVAINNAIEGYTDVSNCFAFSLKLQGQSFVIFSFPDSGKTWAFSETVGAWFELSSGTAGGRHLANGHCYAFGKHLICDHQNGNIYEWDLETYTDNGSEIVRERVTQPIFSDLLGVAGKTLFWNKLELVINSGKGLATGQGSNPQVILRYSDDHGRTWSTEQWASVGKIGAYQKKVEWHGLGASDTRIYKFRFTDPIPFNMFKLYADVEVGI